MLTNDYQNFLKGAKVLLAGIVT